MPKEEQDKFIYESPDDGKTVTRRTPESDKKEVIQGDYYKDIPWSGVEDNRDSDLDWIEKSGGFEWTPEPPWPPEVPDEPVRDGSDLPTVGVSTDMGVAILTQRIMVIIWRIWMICILITLITIGNQ